MNQETTEKPEGFEDELSEYGPQVWSGGEPIAWGFSIISHLGETRLNELSRRYNVRRIAFGRMCVLTKILTRKEAMQKYGPVTEEKYGPRGGWQYVMFGDKKFDSEFLKPKKVA